MGRDALCWAVAPETDSQAALPGSAHRPPAPPAALRTLGRSQGQKRSELEPRGWLRTGVLQALALVIYY